MLEELRKLMEENQNFSDKINALQQEKCELAHRCVDAERKQYFYQNLFDALRSVTSAHAQTEALLAVTDFVIYKMNLERCALFLDSSRSGYFTLTAYDGYYDSSMDHLMVPLESFHLDSLFDDMLIRTSHTTPQTSPFACFVRGVMTVTNWAAMPLFDTSFRLTGMLIVGNEDESPEYYARIPETGEFLEWLLEVRKLSEAALSSGIQKPRIMAQIPSQRKYEARIR